MRLVRALDRGCQLIALLTGEDESLSVGEIASGLQIPLSTTYELVHTLLYHGFLEEVDGADGNLRVGLGFRLFEAGAAYVNRVSFIEEAQKVVDEAAAELQEATHVAVLEDDHVVYLAKAESPQPSPIRIVSYVGGREPVHVSALGKCLLSDSSLEQLHERLGDGPLEALTASTITDLEVLYEHLKRVERLGYCVDEEESVVGLRCVGVPIRGEDGRIVAALSTSVPAFRLDKSQFPAVAKVLRRHGDALEKRLRMSRPIGWPR